MNSLSGKRNNSYIKWDTSDFPQACEKCLGSNPYIRMSKAEFDLECKICFRPFMVFRWKNGNIFKRTDICLTCSKVKNLCQACLLDFKFGLNMDVRDSFLKKKIDVPKDPTNRDFWAYKISKNIDAMELPYDKDENYTILDKYISGVKKLQRLKEVGIGLNLNEKDETTLHYSNYNEFDITNLISFEEYNKYNNINKNLEDTFIKINPDDLEKSCTENILNFNYKSTKTINDKIKGKRSKKNIEEDVLPVHNENLPFCLEDNDEEYKSFLKLLKES